MCGEGLLEQRPLAEHVPLELFLVAEQRLLLLLLHDVALFLVGRLQLAESLLLVAFPALHTVYQRLEDLGAHQHPETVGGRGGTIVIGGG